MKTTLDIPDPIFRKAKAGAAMQGIPLRQFVAEAIEKKVADASSTTISTEIPAWMQGFGELADLRDETRRIEEIVRGEFGTLEPEDLS